VPDDINLRKRLSDPPARILNRLPLAGKLMIVAQRDGVTHERIGIVERLEKQGDRVLCIGEAHDCSIDVASVTSVVIDRTARMKDKVLPKLEFQNAGEETLFTVVSLDNADKFDLGFATLPGVPIAVPDKKSSEASSLANDDPAFAPLRAAIEAGTEIQIQMRRPGLDQRWRGIVPPINPAMGFINLIAADFHLHLRGGTVANWQSHKTGVDGAIELSAIGQDGNPLGLVLIGPAATFGLT
jgi:putative heme degradation protein